MRAVSCTWEDREASQSGILTLALRRMTGRNKSYDPENKRAWFDLCYADSADQANFRPFTIHLVDL